MYIALWFPYMFITMWYYVMLHCIIMWCCEWLCSSVTSILLHCDARKCLITSKCDVCEGICSNFTLGYICLSHFYIRLFFIASKCDVGEGFCSNVAIGYVHHIMTLLLCWSHCNVELCSSQSDVNNIIMMGYLQHIVTFMNAYVSFHHIVTFIMIDFFTFEIYKWLVCNGRFLKGFFSL